MLLVVQSPNGRPQCPVAISSFSRNKDDAIMPVTWLLTVGQPAVGPVSAVNGQSGIIGNQAEMMELEAAVIDGTRFLCYDDGATVPRRRPAYPDPNLRSNRACLPGRPSRLALHEALRKRFLRLAESVFHNV